MDTGATQDHYARLAATFDENWAYSPAFTAWMAGCIRRRLRLDADSVVIDVGCGTGLYARELARAARAVVCADQSPAMLARVPRDGNLAAVTASAEDLAAGRVPLPHERYDAILLKEVLHHVSDQAGVISGLAGLLRPGGRMLVVMLPAVLGYPLFPAALELFARRQPDPAGLAGAMRAAGLRAEVTSEGFPLTFTTAKYLQMVHNRYMSLLSSFSDAELEAGIRQIRDAHPGEEVSFLDTFAFVLGTAA
jgi:SAM-dependent methyltransferase